MIDAKDLDCTPAMFSAVNAYLVARAYAETVRAEVDAIQRDILETGTYRASDRAIGRGRSERILEPKDTWLMADDDFIDFMLDMKERLKEAGYPIAGEDPERPHSYNCPALVAENLQRDCEVLVIHATAKMIGVEDPERFRLQFCRLPLENYRRFIDLAVTAVVKHPDFKSPLDKEGGSHAND